MRTPLKHQQLVIDLIKDKDRYGLYLSPGLGKTFTALHDWYHSDRKNLLILTLPSLLQTWEDEAEKMDFPEPIKILKLNKGSTTSMKEMIESVEKNERGIYIVSYTSSWRMNDLLNFNKRDFSLVFDESHKTKNRASKQAKFSKLLTDRYERVRLLTGTPTSLGYIDYFWPLKLLGENDPRTKTVKEFEKNFVIKEEGKTMGGQRFAKIVGYQNTDLLKDIINKTAIFMSEESSGVELPDQIEKTFSIEMDREYKKAIKDRVFKTWMVKNTGSKMMAYRTGASGFMYGEDMYGERVVEQFKNQPKQNIFRDILEGLDNRKVLVFYNFEQEKHDIKSVVESIGKKVSFITKDDVDVSGDVIATHYITGSTGHNLQHLTHIIYYSPTIVGSDFIQSKKRIHRIGQDKTCYYYHLITKGSIEEKIFEKIRLNEDYTEQMFSGEYGDEE